jgi:hypothetical protein
MLEAIKGKLIHTECQGHAYVAVDSIVCGKCCKVLYVEIPDDTVDIYGDQLSLGV